MTVPTPHLHSLSLLEGLIEEAELDWEGVLDAEAISWDTGLPVGIVRAGLSRRPMAEIDFLEQVVERLKFLRRTRLRRDGVPYTQTEIAEGAGVTPQWVGELLKGRAVPKLEHAARIEDFFRVPRGFLTATPSQALDRAFREKLETLQAQQLAGLKALKERYELRKVAFRGAPETLAKMQALLEVILDDQQGDRRGDQQVD
ncbi:helix-turn-helix transcriptional regulator [Streptomyces sp. NPDC056492]|uniref:helix-turn-helix transcriptional regulator n=1 Tax=unclassified Streptomyces TaxID=2593676 RepID=UPI0036A17773